MRFETQEGELLVEIQYFVKQWQREELTTDYFHFAVTTDGWDLLINQDCDSDSILQRENDDIDFLDITLTDLMKASKVSLYSFKLEDFPEGTEFYIKEFDVPLANIPNIGWVNYFGGKARQYDVTDLKPGNNWPADNFSQWIKIVDESR